MPVLPESQPSVVVVGGGLAGLAAACALAEHGCKITLCERRPFLGGRASSYEHPVTGEVVDNCQHVLFGVCTNLLAFYRQIGMIDKIRWYDQMYFVEPGGRVSILKPTALPAPLQTLPSFMGFPFLSSRDKFSIARAMSSMVPQAMGQTGGSFLDWLKDRGATTGAIEKFWKPVLISALSEDLDKVSVPAAVQVVRETMKSTEARRMGIPKIPLSDLYAGAQRFIEGRGGEVRLKTGVKQVRPSASGVAIDFESSTQEFDYAILGLPYFSLAPVLPQNGLSQPLRDQIAKFESCPITGVHLWFDREICELDHAVLLDRTIQWMFHKSRLIESAPGERQGSYVELVISASKTLIPMTKQQVVDLALAELAEFFPAVKDAVLLKSAVIKELNATYSPRPGIEEFRPSSRSVWERMFLAGDWTATGWPATMEGAVRSGYLAAEALLKSRGKDAKLIHADLPATGLMRLFY